MNFTTEYYPDLAELTDEQLSSARQIVISKLQASFVDVDLQPGSPTGDMVVTPLAAFLAASDVAHDRLMSDLDLGNVADGLIYSCDFVTKYLGNFAVYDVENLRAAGLARLTFSTNVQRAISRHTLFRFGTTDDFSPLLGNSTGTELVIHPAGTAVSGVTDEYVLSQTSASTWAVDIPVTGTLTQDVAIGAAGTITQSLPGLSLIAAAIDFLPGVPSASLSDLAKLARVAAHALTTSSRNGIKALAYRHWPETRMVSPILTGDPEMLRTTPGSALILQAPAVDVYYRSARDLQTETQIVRLSYSADFPHDESTRALFRGDLQLMHRPSKILSVEWAEQTGHVAETFLYTVNAAGPSSSQVALGTNAENFRIEVAPTMDIAFPDTPTIDLLEDEDGLYAMFAVTYLADPLVATVATVLESEDNAPPGVDLKVKSGPLSEITSMTISYRKTPGTKMLLSAAAVKISAYVRQAGYPSPFRQTAIHDIMKLAGASMVASIAVEGLVYATPASRLITNTNADWFDNSTTVQTLPIASIDDVVPDNPDTGGWAATERTLRYFLDAANINFIELP